MKHLLIQIIKKTVTLLSVILIIIVSGSFIILGTDRGVQLLIISLDDIGLADLQAAQVSGNLLGQLELTDLQYTAVNSEAKLQIKIHKLHLHWQPRQLFNSKAVINNLRADGVKIKQIQLSPAPEISKPAATGKGTQLPEIVAPLPVFLQQLHLTDITFSPSPESQPVIIESLQLQAELINTQLKLHHLKLVMPEAQATLKGSAQLQGNYPLDLNSTISLHLPEYDELVLNGAINGDLMTLNVIQNSSGLFNALIKAQIKYPLGELQWNSDIDVTQLPLSLLIKDNNEQLSGQLTMTGNLSQANIVLTAYPVVTEADSDSVEKNPVRTNLLEIKAHTSWHEALKWQASLQVSKLTPERWNRQWPGSIDMTLQTDGQLTDKYYQATVKLNHLSGQLHQKDLAGTGEFNIDTNKITIKQLELSTGEAKLKINGELSEQVNLEWLIAIEQLADILPNSRGSINAKGRLRGSTRYPVLDASLKLKNIAHNNMTLAQADLICQLDSNPGTHSEINFNGQLLKLDAQQLEQLKLTFQGSLEKHHIQLYARHEQANLKLNAQGQLDRQSVNWNGIINHIAIDSKQLGLWTQQQSTQLSAGLKKVVLSPLCLFSALEKKAAVCTELNWTAEQGTAKTSLRNISLQQYSSYFPEGITQLSGVLDITADIKLTPQFQSHIRAQLTPGELAFQPLAQQEITLPHQNTFLQADYNKQQLATTWQLELGPHTVNGKLNIDRKELENKQLDAAMQGNMSIDLKDLNLLTVLLPQLTEIDGHVLTELQLGGRINTPLITGQASLIAKHLSIRDIGLRITNIAVHLQDKNAGKDIALQGNMHSGKGIIAIDGLLHLNSAQGWPLTINLKGDDFLAINIPDAYVVMSPDIHFSQKKNLMQIQGKIRIPEATIAPATLPEGSMGISSDVEILGSEKKQAVNMDLDIELSLGNKVRLDAFGLKSDLLGELTISQKARQLMTGNGELNLSNGTFRAYGQDLSISQGSIFYAGGYIDNPGVKLIASRIISDTTVGINVSGSVKKPRITTFSDDKELQSKDIVSMLLTGQKTDNLGNTKIYAGKEISDRLSIGVNTGIGEEGSEFVTRYKLTDKIQLEGTCSTSKNSGSIIYTFELE